MMLGWICSMEAACRLPAESAPAEKKFSVGSREAWPEAWRKANRISPSETCFPTLFRAPGKSIQRMCQDCGQVFEDLKHCALMRHEKAQTERQNLRICKNEIIFNLSNLNTCSPSAIWYSTRALRMLAHIGLPIYSMVYSPEENAPGIGRDALSSFPEGRSGNFLISWKRHGMAAGMSCFRHCSIREAMRSSVRRPSWSKM